MRTARRTTWQQGIRINYIAPPYVKSAIRTAKTEEYLTKNGVEFALPEDAAMAMMRIAADRTINGMYLEIHASSEVQANYSKI